RNVIARDTHELPALLANQIEQVQVILAWILLVQIDLAVHPLRHDSHLLGFVACLLTTRRGCGRKNIIIPEMTGVSRHSMPQATMMAQAPLSQKLPADRPRVSGCIGPFMDAPRIAVFGPVANSV